MLAPHLIAALKPLEEFVSDPALTVACVLLIVVSIAWVLVARLIWLNLKRAAFRSEVAPRRRATRRRRPYSM
jgi:cell division protein FtsX